MCLPISESSCSLHWTWALCQNPICVPCLGPLNTWKSYGGCQASSRTQQAEFWSSHRHLRSSALQLIASSLPSSAHSMPPLSLFFSLLVCKKPVSQLPKSLKRCMRSHTSQPHPCISSPPRDSACQLCSTSFPALVLALSALEVRPCVSSYRMVEEHPRILLGAPLQLHHEQSCEGSCRARSCRKYVMGRGSGRDLDVYNSAEPMMSRRRSRIRYSECHCSEGFLTSTSRIITGHLAEVCQVLYCSPPDMLASVQTTIYSNG